MKLLFASKNILNTQILDEENAGKPIYETRRTEEDLVEVWHIQGESNLVGEVKLDKSESGSRAPDESGVTMKGENLAVSLSKLGGHYKFTFPGGRSYEWRIRKGGGQTDNGLYEPDNLKKRIDPIVRCMSPSLWKKDSSFKLHIDEEAMPFIDAIITTFVYAASDAGKAKEARGGTMGSLVDGVWQSMNIVGPGPAAFPWAR